MTVRAFSHEALSRVRVVVGRKLPELRWQVSRSRGPTHIHNIPIIMLFIPLGVGSRIQESYVCIIPSRRGRVFANRVDH